ncbi:MAG: peptidoglycan DD-metalloendopeptidase family protein [Vicinamibacterales bacterium]|nr:peptidoglycan DD-metalloendopeptidase family protein [Vicinamibacterales bacterium]
MRAVLVFCTALGLLLAAAPAMAQSDRPTVECRSRDGHDNNRTQHTLTVDPSSPSTLWLGVEYGGVFRSLNGGETWARADTAITGYNDTATGERCIQEMGRIVVDPLNPNHVLMSRIDSPGTITMTISENAGVWQTTNGGVSWAQIIKAGMNASGSAATALAPGGVIYHGVNNNRASWDGAPPDLYNTTGILYHSADRGATWRELPTGAPEGLRSTAVFVNPANPAHLWFVVLVARNGGAMQAAEQWTYLESRDAGETWERGAGKFPAAWRIPTDATVSSRTFNHRMLATGTTEGPQASFATLDGGATWTRMSHYLFTARYDPHDATAMHAVGYAPYEQNPGLFESRDGGVTWTRFANTPSEVDHQANFGVRITEIVWHPTDPNTIYMSASGGYAWKSIDGGRNWRTIFTIEQMARITEVVSASGGPVFSSAFVDPSQAVAFYPFGTVLPSGVHNPTFEIETADPSATVHAASAGRVLDVRPTSQGDSTIFVLPSEDMQWGVVYDHVNNVTVEPGSMVEPGVILGTVGRLGNGRGRTELQINRFGVQPELAYCPLQFGTQAFNELYVTAARRINGSPTTCAAPAVVP